MSDRLPTRVEKDANSTSHYETKMSTNAVVESTQPASDIHRLDTRYASKCLTLCWHCLILCMLAF